MKEIDDLPLHLKNKMLIYQRYVLSKLSWNLSIADIDITWVKLKNIYNFIYYFFLIGIHPMQG